MKLVVEIRRLRNEVARLCDLIEVINAPPKDELIPPKEGNLTEKLGRI